MSGTPAAIVGVFVGIPIVSNFAFWIRTRSDNWIQYKVEVLSSASLRKEPPLPAALFVWCIKVLQSRIAVALKMRLPEMEAAGLRAVKNIDGETGGGGGTSFEIPAYIPVPSPNESPAVPDLSHIATQVAAERRARGGRNIGVYMSGHLRCRLAACLLLAGLSTSPAYSNPVAALINAAPGEATAPAPAEEACLPQPGKSTADGRHWVYRFHGHRKCWFQAAEGAPVKKPVHHPAAKQHVAAPENESALGKQKAVVDARAELLHSAPAETSQPTPPARELKVVDAAPVPAMGAAALVPSPPFIANPASDQFTPDHPTPRQVDVETLLAAAPSASDATGVAVTLAEASDDGPGWMTTWLAVLLMALGLVSLLLRSSRSLRWPAISRSKDELG